MQNLEGSVVAITGASSGIGAATARSLAAAGAKVVVGARRAERLTALVDELDGAAIAVEMDVRSIEDGKRLVAAAVEAHGRLDTLVANAGIGIYGGIMDTSDEQIEAMISTNVTGTVWGVRAAVPALLEAGGGDIIIVASVAGIRGAEDEAVYAATKFAQIGLAGAIDRELRAKNIRVTAICPGGVATEFAMGTGRSPGMAGLDEMLRPEDVAEAIVTVLRQPKTMRSLVWSMRSIHEAD
ncbi:MAG: SDR family oxidoreductase [Acidimicrobiia bacterium]